MNDTKKSQKKIKFTFKTKRPEAGLRGVGTNPLIEIKLNKKIVGHIRPVQWDTKEIEIWLAIENDNGKWNNRKLKFIPKTTDEAKEYLNNHTEWILNNSKLHAEND